MDNKLLLKKEILQRCLNIIALQNNNDNMVEVFTNVYETNEWGNNNKNEYSGSSGDGSAIDFNKNTYVVFLKNFIKEYNIKTITELGCGDF